MNELENKVGCMGEFGLIDMVSSFFPVPDGVTGIGDDCAVLPQIGGMDTLVSTDMLVEGTHFLFEDISPYQLGWKSAAVNISDIAAMGGRPSATFLSLAIPASLPVKWTEEFIRGYRDVSAKYACPLLGGDTVSSADKICINVTVLGTCAHGTAVKRSSAKVGDLICVTGPLGDSACGLKVILDGAGRGADAAVLVERHYRPVPRVEEGLQIASLDGVHSMMDISDGIGSDLGHILKLSGVGAEISLSEIPLSEELERVCAVNGWDPYDFAVSGGEDYELLFTIDPACEGQLAVPHYVIGRITAGTGIVWLGGGGKSYRGYSHF